MGNTLVVIVNPDTFIVNSGWISKKNYFIREYQNINNTEGMLQFLLDEVYVTNTNSICIYGGRVAENLIQVENLTPKEIFSRYLNDIKGTLPLTRDGIKDYIKCCLLTDNVSLVKEIMSFYELRYSDIFNLVLTGDVIDRPVFENNLQKLK